MIHALAARIFLGGVVAAFGFLFGRPKAPQPLIDAAELANAGLVQYWQVELPTVKGERFGQLVLVDQNLYCVSDRGAVVVVHAPTGVIRWITELAEPGATIFEPTHRSSDVCLTTRGKVALRQQADGKETALLEIDFVPSAAAVADQQRLYVPGIDGMLRCLRLSDQVLLWRVRTAQPVVADPVLTTSVLYFASRDGVVHACRAQNKAKLWTVDLDTPIVARPGLLGRGLLVAGVNGSLYCLDAVSGKLHWRFRTPGQLRTAPVATKDAIYQYSQDHGLYAVDPATGRQIWQREAGLQFLAQDGSVAFVLNGLGEIVAVDNKTARQIAVVQATDVELAATNPDGPAMFLADRGGRLVCVRPAAHPYLRRKEVTAAWRVGPTDSREEDQLDTSKPAPGKTALPPPFDPLRSDDRTPTVAGYRLVPSPAPARP